MVVLLENPAGQNALSGDHLVDQVGGAVEKPGRPERCQGIT